MTTPLPSSAQAKDMARRLRVELTEKGTPIGHAKALELVARNHGFRDWNTMSAAIGKGVPEAWNAGKRVSGRYLGQRFDAVVVAVSTLRPGWHRIELDLDEAVDVITFDGLSNFRKRIRGVIGPKGHALEKTSDGQPHLQIDVAP
ncbi:MAG: glyoxalase superfamily protein [Pseudomonadota bacterium]